MYAKLFASIYQGTLRGNSNSLLVFTNMLAHADAAGWVDIHPRAISEEVGLPIDQVQDAIRQLESPDPESRSPEEDGRRIVRLDEHRVWGWRVVNHGKYRAIRSDEDRREQNRLAQERFRAKHKAESKQSKPRKPRSAQAEAEAEEENTLSDKSDGARFNAFWSAYPKKVGRDAAAKAFAKRTPSERTVAAMLVAIEAQKKSAQWMKSDGEFIPLPATWLNQGRWKDGIVSSQKSVFDGGL